MNSLWPTSRYVKTSGWVVRGSRLLTRFSATQMTEIVSEVIGARAKAAPLQSYLLFNDEPKASHCCSPHTRLMYRFPSSERT
jgi:hypothetical protein